MSVEELLAVNVDSVTRKPVTWGDAPASVFLVRPVSIAITGAQTLPEVLRLAPNLFVAQSSASQWAVNARGFVRTNSYSNKLLVQIDGRTAYSPLFSNVFWDATTVFVPDLDRIEVIAGPAGSAWGSNAVNGVINIQTRSARDTLGGLLQTVVGTDLRQFSARYGAPVGSGAVRVYAQHQRHDPTRSAAGAEDEMDGWRATQGGFRADWGKADTGEFTVSGDVFTGRYATAPGPEVRNDGYNFLARWSRQLSPVSHLWVRAYHDYTMRDTQGAITEITRVNDLEFQHRIQLTNTQEFLWGANYRLMSDSIHDTLGFVILPASLDFALGSVFAQHEIELRPAWWLTSGLRLEHNHFSGWETQPSVRLSWRRPRETFWLAASRATRIPSRLDTGFHVPMTPPYVIAGGPDFKAEVLTAFELGWRRRVSRDLSFTATVFAHHYDSLRSVELSTPIVVANTAGGRSVGVEYFVDWDVTRAWRMRIGGFAVDQDTWSHSPGIDSERGRGETSFPATQLQFRNTFRLSEKVTLWTGLRRVSAVPAFENNTAGLVPAYTELDAALTWTITPRAEISISGRNLLQPSHPEIGSNATRREIPRAGRVALRIGF